MGLGKGTCMCSGRDYVKIQSVGASLMRGSVLLLFAKF